MISKGSMSASRSGTLLMSRSIPTSPLDAISDAAELRPASLELAAAVWDGRIFLKLDALFPLNFSSMAILMPAVMCIAAIYAGVGLLQMRRSACTTWMVRHAWLGGIYLLSLPFLSAQTVFYPGLSVIILWRSAILIFSVLAGLYLFAVRSRFDNGSAR